MLPRFRRKLKPSAAARRLYDGVVSRARQSIFHTGLAVPDTLDGRFDLLSLHAFAVMDALKSAGPAAEKVGTELASLIFAGFDDALRQLGVSDMGMGRRIRAMADAFYGRLEAYGAARDEDELAAALLRNVYRGDESRRRETAALVHYIFAVRQNLRNQSGLLLQGQADFGSLPVVV
jgi:cytochrome b pre-mRNA-processing protein 3